MAAPILTNVYPTIGPSSGGTALRLLGLNFAEKVEVEFAGRPATAVAWLNSSLLHVTTPTAPVDPIQGGQAAVDVVVRNLDINGDPVPGEEFTFPIAYTFQMPNLAEESQLTYVVRTLILELRRQILAETVMNQHSDYSNSTAPDGEDTAQIDDEPKVTRLAKLPSLVILGPRLLDNQVRQLFDVVQTNAGGEWFNQLAPTSVDLGFEIMGVANKTQTLLNLMHAVVQFFRRNRKLSVPCDSSDPTGGSAEFDLEWQIGGMPLVQDRMNDSDVLSFSGNFLIRDVQLSSLAGVEVPEGLDANTDRGKPLADSVEISPATRTGNCQTATLKKLV